MRQRLFFPVERRAEALRELRALGFDDLVYLHTCNRVEFYTTGRDFFTDSRPLWQALLRHVGLDDDDFYRGYHFEGKSAVRHVLRVACSLESLVVGEPQILGQLKDAIRFSQEHGLGPARPVRRVFDFVFSTAKAVRTETAIGEKPVSVASLALRQAIRDEALVPLRSVVLVGRSPMVQVVLQWLAKHRPSVPVRWVNRDPDKLRALPGAEHARLEPLAEFLARPGDFSHLFTATASLEPLFHRAFFDALPPGQRRVFDLAEPADVNADAYASPRATVVSIADLSEEARGNVSQRQASIERAQRMVDEALRTFVLSQKESPWLREFSAVESQLGNDLAEALEALPAGLSPELKDRIAVWARKLQQKNLHVSREHLRTMLRKFAEEPAETDG